LRGVGKCQLARRVETAEWHWPRLAVAPSVAELRASFRSSGWAQGAAIVLLALGCLLAAIGLLLVLGLQVPSVVGSGVNWLGLPFMVIGLFYVATAWSAWNHRRWAQVVGVLFGLLGIALGYSFLSSVNDPVSTAEAGSAWPAIRWLIVGSVVPYALVTAGMLLGNRHFTASPDGNTVRRLDDA
jgi:hypothetical protein